MSVSVALLEANIRSQVLLERLKSGEVRKFEPFLREIDRMLRDKLALQELSTFQRTRLESLLREVDSLLGTIFGRYTQQLQADLLQVADYQSGLEARSIGNAVASYVPNIPSDTQIKAAILSQPLSVRGVGGGKLLQAFISDWSKSERDTLTGAIRQGYFEGQTNAQIVQRIRGTKALKYADGLLDVTSRHANAIVRTSIQHVAGVARFETWQANTDIVKGYEWVSTLDSRTTVICQSLDGRVFELGGGPVPPAHVNCRSTTTPVLDDSFSFLRKGAERASQDGPVPASETYYSWLKGQPAAFQNEVLGKSRAQLFRDGGLSAERFAALQLDRNFQPLTLDEMKRLEPLAFERAGI
jgi:SPP1 gp7 family putative phage head morphogenesis protein